jgi:hypothetical protein
MRGDGAAPADIAGASALLLFGSAVLRRGGTGKEKRHSADDEGIVVQGYLCAMDRAVNGVAAVGTSHLSAQMVI